MHGRWFWVKICQNPDNLLIIFGLKCTYYKLFNFNCLESGW